MPRTVFEGGRVFDGTGAPLADADVVIEDGRILEIGPGLDGDEVVDCSGSSGPSRRANGPMSWWWVATRSTSRR